MSWPDVEGAVRDHLRNDPTVAGLVGQRVFFGVPLDANGNVTSQLPLVTVQRVGGGDDDSEAPVDQALIQIDCWAASRNKAQAHQVASAVRTALTEIRTVPVGSTVLHGATVESVIWAPDPKDHPRYSLTALVSATAA